MPTKLRPVFELAEQMREAGIDAEPSLPVGQCGGHRLCGSFAKLHSTQPNTWAQTMTETDRGCRLIASHKASPFWIVGLSFAGSTVVFAVGMSRRMMGLRRMNLPMCEAHSMDR